MKILFTLFFLCAIIYATAQDRSAPDQIETNNGELIIQPIVHGTVVLTWDGKTIYVDPYGGAEGFNGLADPDLILITDIHGDHLDIKTLNSLNTSKAKFIVPPSVMDQLPEEFKEKALVMDNGDNIDYNGMNISAIPMYNLPEDETSMHIRGRGNGYVLSMGGKKIYLSGDTEDIEEMRSLTNIDIAFVCMNLPYTMDINQAASAVLQFKPYIVYPYHYRGKEEMSDVRAFMNLVNAGNQKIEVRLRNWYPEN